MTILVVGSVAYDTIKTHAALRERILGGSATYFSLAASRFAKVRLVAVVGEDFKEEHVRVFEKHDVCTAGLQRIQGGKTFFWSGVYSDDFVQRTTLETQLNVFEQFDPLLSEPYRNSEILVLGNIHPDLQLKVLDQIQSPRFSVLDTMPLWIQNTRQSLEKVISRVDCLVINDEESFLLSGQRNIHKAAEHILQMGPRFLIIKRGEFGAALYDKNQVFLLPAFPVGKVVDPTGAGDSFAGGLAGHLARETDITFAAVREAVVTGTLVASFTVEDFSVDRLMGLTTEELERRRRAFFEATRWG